MIVSAEARTVAVGGIGFAVLFSLHVFVSSGLFSDSFDRPWSGKFDNVHSKLSFWSVVLISSIFVLMHACACTSVALCMIYLNHSKYGASIWYDPKALTAALLQLGTTNARSFVRLVLRIVWCALYVVEAYFMTRDSPYAPWDVSTIPLWLIVAQVGFGVLVCSDLALGFAAAETKSAFARSGEALADAVLSPVLLLTLFAISGDKDYVSVSARFGYLRFVCLLDLHMYHAALRGLDEVNLLIVQTLVRLVGVTLLCAGFFYEMEAPDTIRGFSSYFDFMYFMLITMSTVGYGDWAPSFLATRLAAIFIILLVMTTVPAALSQLAQAYASAKRRSGALPAPCEPHFVIVGDIRPHQLDLLLRDLFGRAPTARPMRVCVLTALALEEYPTEFYHRRYRRQVCLLRGDLLSTDVGLIERLELTSAVAIFVIATSERGERAQRRADTHAALVALAIGKFLRAAVPRLYVQLNGDEHTRTLADMGVRHVLAQNTLKMKLLGKSAAGCKGLTTAVAALFMLDEAGAELASSTRLWVREAWRSWTFELYVAQLPPALVGEAFAVAAVVLHRASAGLVILVGCHAKPAVAAEPKPRSTAAAAAAAETGSRRARQGRAGSFESVAHASARSDEAALPAAAEHVERLFLNPAVRVLAGVELLVLADSAESVEALGATPIDPALIDDVRSQFNLPPHGTPVAYASGERTRSGGKRLSSFASTGAPLSRSPRTTATDGPAPPPPPPPAAAAAGPWSPAWQNETSLFGQEGARGGSHEHQCRLRRASLSADPGQTMAGAATEPEAASPNGALASARTSVRLTGAALRPMSEVLCSDVRPICARHNLLALDGALVESVILICGWAGNLTTLVRTAASLCAHRIVILAPVNPQSSAEAAEALIELRAMARVHFVCGSPLDELDLERAGLKYASCALLFGGVDLSSRAAQADVDGSAAAESVGDSHVVLSVTKMRNMLKAWHRSLADVQFLVDLDDLRSVRFVDDGCEWWPAVDTINTYLQSPAIASGTAYADEMSCSMVTANYYMPYLTQLLNGFVGDEQTAGVEQLPIPVLFGGPLTFGDLFGKMAVEGYVVLGLYCPMDDEAAHAAADATLANFWTRMRAKSSAAELLRKKRSGLFDIVMQAVALDGEQALSYVLLNPPPERKIGPADRMFVISRDTLESSRIQPHEPRVEPRHAWAAAARKSLVAERDPGASACAGTVSDASIAQSAGGNHARADDGSSISLTPTSAPLKIRMASS